MTKYIDAEKLKSEIERQQRRLTLISNTKQVDMRRDCALKNGVYDSILGIINSLQQEPPKLYKDETLGSPDYERGFKHGRDYQTEVAQKYINKDKVVAYLVDKGYPVSINGEIPTYQETFDMINNAIKHANKQEQPEVDFEDIEFLLDKVKYMSGLWVKTNPNCTKIINAFNNRLNARKEEQI